MSAPEDRAVVAQQLRVRSGTWTADVTPAELALVLAEDCGEPTQQLLRSLRAEGHTRLVLIVAELDEAGSAAAAQAGASVVLRRAEISVDRLAEEVEAAAVDASAVPSASAPTALSARETTVLRLLAEGFDTAEVARAVCWSERTVKNVVHDVTRRLELRNRTHAVAYALRRGLL